jgi:hypothetical protein
MSAAYRRAMESYCWFDASTDEFADHPEGAPWFRTVRVVNR